MAGWKPDGNDLAATVGYTVVKNHEGTIQIVQRTIANGHLLDEKIIAVLTHLGSLEMLALFKFLTSGGRITLEKGLEL